MVDKNKNSEEIKTDVIRYNFCDLILKLGQILERLTRLGKTKKFWNQFTDKVLQFLNQENSQKIPVGPRNSFTHQSVMNCLR